ncbi:hypothetical protein AB5J62_00480 [Amycolatopsis sp. cg5]|uniref:hypothetical protein n=1 Tax=Amycolatopsis sp. cg5 TaxID=3238802 RepID=UPI0035257541
MDVLEEEETVEAKEKRPFPVRKLGLALLALAVLVAGAFFAWQYKTKSDIRAAGDAALATARSYAVTVTTYDFQNLDRNFADVLDGATGEFKDQYTGASGSLRQLIQEAKATARGTVVESGLKSATADRAEVLLFVDQSVTNAATKDPRVDRNRVLMTLEHHDSRWLVSSLQLL